MMKRIASGVVPFKVEGGVCKVLLVKSTNGRNWIFPKGGVEPELSKRENALKEAWEEAGVIGIPSDKIGKYTFVKGGVVQIVHMYEMQVVAELDVYPEVERRERTWVPLSKVAELVGVDHQFLLVPLMERFA